LQELSVPDSERKFWKDLSLKMDKFTSYRDLSAVVVATMDTVPALPRRSDLCHRLARLDRDPEDDLSRQCVPIDCPMEDVFAVRTIPDGSCLTHAASRLIYGHQNREDEMRFRIVREMYLQEEYLLDESYMRKGVSDLREGEQVLPVLFR